MRVVLRVPPVTRLPDQIPMGLAVLRGQMEVAEAMLVWGAILVLEQVLCMELKTSGANYT